ncbi:MAG: hypothetical protein PHO08_19260 [Methylococcales bacterium]|nr:hypothetical protein [Methylococcales bacterium]MDD5631775.1 hypothetical protein [Methylococcales bacterium]
MNTTSIERGRITARVPARIQESLAIAASMVGANAVSSTALLLGF